VTRDAVFESGRAVCVAAVEAVHACCAAICSCKQETGSADNW